jgi:hypothetical protein
LTIIGGTAEINTSDALSLLAVLSNVARRFATARRVPDMDRISNVEMIHHGDSIGRIMIHVTAVSPVQTGRARAGHER